MCCFHQRFVRFQPVLYRTVTILKLASIKDVLLLVSEIQIGAILGDPCSVLNTFESHSYSAKTKQYEIKKHKPDLIQRKRQTSCPTFEGFIIFKYIFS